MNQHFSKADIQSCLQQALPGWEGQKKLSVLEDQSLRIKGNPDAKQAGVMLIFVEEHQNIIIIERSSHPMDKHKGQLSFPGGRYEKHDDNMLNTALRETSEEIGLTISNQDVIGPLSPLYIPVSDFMVHPFVAVVQEARDLTPEPQEVHQILHLPIHELLTEEFPNKNITTPTGFRLENVPYIPLNEKIIWGATGMILGELSSLLLPYHYNRN